MSKLKTITTSKTWDGCKVIEYCRFDGAAVKQEIENDLINEYQNTQTAFNTFGLQFAVPTGPYASYTHAYAIYQFSSVAVSVTPTTVGDKPAYTLLCDGQSTYFDPLSLNNVSSPICNDKNGQQQHCSKGCSSKKESWDPWGAETNLGACLPIKVGFSYVITWSKISGQSFMPNTQNGFTQYGTWSSNSVKFRRERIGSQRQRCTCSLVCY